MRKLSLLPILVLVFVLTGCLSSETSPTPTSRPAPTTILDIPSVSEGSSPDSGCTVVANQNSVDLTPDSPFLPVTLTDWTLGSADAPITIIEYSDFQCPYCSQFAPIMDRLLADFPNDLRFVFRHFPLIGTPESPFHDKAALSTQAAEAAGRQGKFWEMHAVLFERQSEWATLSIPDFQTWLIDLAGEIELDVNQFTTDLTSQALVDFAQSKWDEGTALGLSGTPFLVYNGNVWPSNVPMDYWSIWAVIKLTMLEDQQYTQCPTMSIDQTAQYIATIETAKGNIVIELYPDVAPLTVNSFIFLVENGWFDGVTFHRVIPGFVAQAGDPSGTGFGGPGYAFQNEISADYTFDGPGVVAMANAGADSNGSQFFITYAPAPTLDGNYTIFGRVIEGMDVAESLTARDPSANADLPPGDVIIRVTIEQR
jgi:cyclophilin family peptidyl-prolyl cis-trans isomerase/protein-disulfide isomerase